MLLLVLPSAGAGVVLQAHWFAVNLPSVAISTLGLCGLMGLVVLKLRAGTPGAAFAGAVITANLMFSTAVFPYRPWQSALVPVLAVFLLTHFATRVGREQKVRMGTAEKRHGRTASQVAANLGVAALACNEVVQSSLIDSHWFSTAWLAPPLLFALGLAALAEAAADTVSSELGQVLGGRPRMITTMRQVEPGLDGAISMAGTLAGAAAAGLVAAAGSLALRGGLLVFAVSWGGALFGLFFDSLLGATLERRGWINNDAVNFLSTASAAAFALALLVLLPHPGVG